MARRLHVEYPWRDKYRLGDEKMDENRFRNNGVAPWIVNKSRTIHNSRFDIYISGFY